MRVTPTLRFARALRDDTEPRSAYTATIWWLFAFVGLANWFFVFCLFVQVPVLIAVKGGHEAGGLPEGIRLSSFLNVFQQLGNGVALVMMFSLRASAIPTFGTLLLLAAVAASATMAALLPCANNLAVDADGCDNGFIVRTVWGHRRSVGIWAAAFVSGVIGSSGNLIVVPYMSRFRSGYTSAYFAGTGLSGIFASALAAAQVWDASDASPNFGPDTFCAVVSASCSASLVAWLAIVKMDYDFNAAEAALCSAGATRDYNARPGTRRAGGGGGGEGAGDGTGSTPTRGSSPFAGWLSGMATPGGRRRGGAGRGAAASGRAVGASVGGGGIGVAGRPLRRRRTRRRIPRGGSCTRCTRGREDSVGRRNRRFEQREEGDGRDRRRRRRREAVEPPQGVVLGRVWRRYGGAARRASPTTACACRRTPSPRSSWPSRRDTRTYRRWSTWCITSRPPSGSGWPV